MSLMLTSISGYEPSGSMPSRISPNRSVPPAMTRALPPASRRMEAASSIEPALTCLNVFMSVVSSRRPEVDLYALPKALSTRSGVAG